MKMPAHLCGSGFSQKILGWPVGTLKTTWDGLIIDIQVSYELCTVGGTPILGGFLGFKDTLQ